MVNTTTAFDEPMPKGKFFIISKLSSTRAPKDLEDLPVDQEPRDHVVHRGKGDRTDHWDLPYVLNVKLDGFFYY